MLKSLSKYTPVIVLFLSLFFCLSLLTPGIPPTHDGEYHVLRFSQFYKVLGEGVMLPRWAPDFNNGFGIPLFTYVYPLPNYIASLLHFIGFSFIDAFKINMILASLVGAIFFYFLSKEYWGQLGGLVSAVFYSSSPYRLLDIYVRGSVGEVWAIAIFPALLWGIYKFYLTRKYNYFVFSSVMLALLILSHNILAVIFFLFLVLYFLFLIFSSKKIMNDIINFFFIVFIGLGLSSPFWLPAIFEMHYVAGLKIFNPVQNFPEIYQLVIPSWGYGLSPNDLTNPMSIQIGVANLIAFFIAIVALIFLEKKKFLGFLIVLFIFIFFLMTSYSSFIWKNNYLFSYFQFPWRLLSIEIIIASFLSGAVFLIIKNLRLKILTAVVLILIATGLSFSYAKGATYYSRDDNYYLSRSNFTDGTNSPGNLFNTRWLAGVPERRQNRFELMNKKSEVEIINEKSNEYKIRVKTEKDNLLIANIAYFPGWVYELRNKIRPVGNQDGKIRIDVPRGENEIIIKMTSTNIQQGSYIYFLFSTLLIIFMRKRLI